MATTLFVAGPAAAQSVEDVMVRGDRSPPGSTASDTISATEARQLPGAFGDPFRAVEAMPGVTPIISGLPYFYVRGAPSGNVGYYFDGVRVPYLFHFGLGPSVIQPSLIAKTDLHKGGYPAELGRYAGGVIEATAMPPADHLHGDAQVRLFDAGGLAEATFADGRGTALVGGRYSYTAALFSLLQSDTTLDYRDYQARVTYALTERDTIGILGFGAYDNAKQRETVDPSTVSSFVDPNAAGQLPSSVDRTLFASEFHRADARWDHLFSGGGNLRVAATVGFDRTRIEAHRSATDVMYGARANFVQPVGKGVVLHAGADATFDHFSGASLAPFSDDDDVVARQAVLFENRTDYVAGAYVDTVITAIPSVELVPGVRFDEYGSNGHHADAVDPRFSAKFFLTKHWRIVHAYGVATQAPSTPLTLPGIGVANLQGGLQKAVQTSGAVEGDLPYDFNVSVGAFHNAFYNLNDALGTAQIEITDIEKSDSLTGKSRGSAYGLEVGVKRKLTNRIGGMLAYTLSRSERTVNGQDFISAYDRPHVLSAAVSADLGRSWRAGARFVTYSGIPMHAATPAFAEQIVGIPPSRTPPFVRLDLRLEKRWNLGKTWWISFVAEALNATLTREVTGYSCGTAIAIPGQSASARCSERVIGPISVPSVGAEGGF